MTTPVLGVLVNTLQYHDIVNFVQDAETEDPHEASERRRIASSQAYRLDKIVSNRSPVQKRRSIYNWNPGPWRWKEDAFEKTIESK